MKPREQAGSFQKKGMALAMSDIAESSGKEKKVTACGNYKVVADPSRMGSPLRLGRRPDSGGANGKWEEN